MPDGTFTNDSLISRGQRAVVGNYRPLPIVIDRGEGARIIDVEGNSFLDLVSGIAVSALGYGHPRQVAAIQEQAGKILHCANIVWNQPMVDLADKLVNNSFAEKVFFSNSGAEANEAMLKLARRYFYDREEGRFEFICFDKSFHGRTMATVTCTGQEKYRVGFEPLLPGVRHVPFGDIAAVESAMTERTAAVLLEPIQGEGGIVLPPPGFLKAVRELCNKHGCLMLLDEVQSGIGRTGTLFAYEQENFQPDMMSLAKGLGGGMPIGAMLTTNAIAASLVPGTHGSTYGGNPVSCASANVVVDEVSQPAFLEQVKQNGAHLLERLHVMAKAHKRIVKEARGRGLWCGLELSVDGSKLKTKGLTRGVLINVIGGHTLRFAPPLVITREELDEGLDVVDSLLAELARA